MAVTETESRAKPLPAGAKEAMERLNAEAGNLNIWLRTQANAPAQRPWFRDIHSRKPHVHSRVLSEYARERRASGD